ncbi:50S ribosomal protein L35 [bacterium]|nr:50S ribosomal protein L35 [bacterium]NUN46486.1 50S ribosomal protein L35 [bacterium]HMV25491.1 50S ribosomal protein L35 [bacterium]HMW33913.1 50S ribosomal protein L35 [bacterium]HMW35835.1 50S ribosomal protein L35 [bacterium]
MPKTKTNSGAKKRFHVTGSGRILRKKATHRHNMSAKSNTRKSNQVGKTEVADSDNHRISHLLGLK